MDNKLVIRAMRGNAKSLDLSCRSIYRVPTSVSGIQNLSVLRLNHNFITALPAELPSLLHLTELHLGNNALEEIPEVLSHIARLKKLHLFGGLHNLVLLNLNHNNIQTLPPEIRCLAKLEILSVTDNQLEGLPPEIGQLSSLTELNLSRNHVSSLPGQLYSCTELSRLHVARNRLTALPEGIGRLTKLKILDVAGNKLSIFPVEFNLMPLEELYCEGNTLVPHRPKRSVQIIPVLTLKELAARFVLLEDRKQCSVVRRARPLHPSLDAVLAGWGRCALCLGPVLNIWLECVHFHRLRKGMKMSLRTVPVRAVLCSYTCFNKSGHAYYGLAFAQ